MSFNGNLSQLEEIKTKFKSSLYGAKKVTFITRTEIPQRSSLPSIWLHFRDGSFDYLRANKKATDYIVVEESTISKSEHVDDESPVTSFSYLVDKLLGGE